MPEQITVLVNKYQRRRLKKMAKHDPDAKLALRCRMIVLVCQGYSAGEVAGLLDCARSTVSRWGHRFNKEGIPGLADRREDNGPTPATGDEERRGLREFLQKTPETYGWQRSTWTVELLAKQLGKQLGGAYSGSAVYRALQSMNARWGRPRPTVQCGWNAAERVDWRVRTDRFFRRLKDDEVALFTDEVDIHLNPKIGADWMLPGKQKRVLTPGQNKKHYVAGALEPKTGAVRYVDGDRKNSALFCDLLRRLAHDVYPKARKIHLFADNFSIHSSRQTRLALQELKGRVVLHYLPPYSPDDNPIERLWKQLHDNVTRNHRCKTMRELMMRTRRFLRQAAPFPKYKFKPQLTPKAA